VKTSDEARRAKKRAYMIAYRAIYNVANKEKIRQYHAAYRAANRGKIKAYLSAYYQSHKKKAQKYQASYRASHLDRVKATRRAHWAKNKGRLFAQQTEYRNNHKAELKAYRANYHSKNRELICARAKEGQRRRWQKDPKFRLLKSLRVRMRIALKRGSKSASTLALLGCTIAQWRTHLESQFRPGMSWENYGSVWHVDHRRPCASFDLLDPAQQRECFHYTNTQPLFVEENLRKSSNINPDPNPYERPQSTLKTSFSKIATLETGSLSHSGRPENY
jgi:hypothetical protein